jgi:hypothetical protein
MEEFKEIISSLNIVLGALCALGGAMIQQRLSAKSKKRELLVQKLERAYELCQLVYEGHRREINNAKKHLPVEKEKFIKERNHPGNEMSELHMLINSYAIDLKSELNNFADAHGEIKDSFRELDSKVLNSEELSAEEYERKKEVWSGMLSSIGHTSKNLKTKLAEKLNAIVN